MDNVWFIYPGQPFIEEGIINALIAFNCNISEGGNFSIYENQVSIKSVAATMIAVESIVKHALDKKNMTEPHDLVELIDIVTDSHPKKSGALVLWRELKILRNDIIHSALFYDSKHDSKISLSSEKRLHTKYVREVLAPNETETRDWQLTINPLRAFRYEALVALTLFYWLGKSTKVWNAGVSFSSVFVDWRLQKEVFCSDWMTQGIYSHIFDHSGKMDFFFAYLADRLPASHKKLYFSMAHKLTGTNLETSLSTFMGFLDMLKS